MPVYEYRCDECGRRTTKLFKTLAAVATPPCDHCGSTRLERLISRPLILKSGGGSDDDGGDDFDGMGDMMQGLESGDPRSLARMARSMSDEMGEEIPEEMEPMLRRMEAGEMPADDEIEGFEPEADAAADDGEDD